MKNSESADKFFKKFDAFMKAEGYTNIKYSLQWEADYSRVQISVLNVEGNLRKRIINSINKQYGICGIKRKKSGITISHEIPERS